MKNDNHVWDNKNPTAQMLGRWQPWHAGHQKLFEETLKKTGQVNIMVRDVKGVDDNPFDFETVKKNIFEAHKSADVIHRAECEKLLDSLSKEEQEKAESASLLTARYLWNFLSGMTTKHKLQTIAA